MLKERAGHNGSLVSEELSSGVVRQNTSVGVTTQAFFLFKFQLQDMVLLFKTVLLPAYTVSNVSFDHF